MRLIVGATLLLSAGLLFLVQPMTGRALLPGFGGAQVVWATSLVFYQGVVLLGYALAHAFRRRTSGRRVGWLVVLVAALGLLAVPVVLPHVTTPRPGAPPTEIALSLALSIGLPALALTVTSPSLQAAFADTDDPRANDPYPLFAISNVGSLVALLGYPFIVEPVLGLDRQALLWSLGYILFLGLLLCALYVVARRRSRTPSLARPLSASDAAPLAWRRVGAWMLLAAVPSALTVAATSVITLDLAAMPLLWIAPLALYLMGYVVAFTPRGGRLVKSAAWLLPVAVILVALVASGALSGPLWLVLAIHLGTLALVATVLHGRLAADRPRAERLTLYYLSVAVGGVAGGAAVALVAPLVFDRLTEYPLLLATALFLAPTEAAARSPAGWYRLDSRLVRAVAAVAVAVILVAVVGGRGDPGAVLLALILPLLSLVPGRMAQAGAIGALLVLAEASAAPAIFTDRSYYSVLRVVDDGAGRRGLYSGTTLQGIQRLGQGSVEPVGYYRPGSPIGQIMTASQARRPALRVGVIGLGIGGLAAYGREEDRITFYELDPLVVRLATDPAYFTVLAQASGDFDVRVGDGRLLLDAEPPGSFDLIIVDAFTSNAIPAHLLTTEALALFRDRLRADGLLVIHVSNRYVELEPVVAAAARAVGLSGVAAEDPGDPADRVEAPSSHWVALAVDPSILDRTLDERAWRDLSVPVGYRAWTDDQIDLPAAVRWGL